MTRLTYADKVTIPPRFRRGTLADYYLDGYDFGEEMAKKLGRSRLRKLTRPELLLVVDAQLDAYARVRDSVYRSGATARQIDAWEHGVYAGAAHISGVA